MYHIGDRIAHPMHGAGIIENIVSERVDGKTQKYYVLRLTSGSMTMLVPCDASAGIRKIVDNARADELLNSFASIPVEINDNWNKRYRDNMLKIKSGDLMQVACVIKSLLAREQIRGLSTGERKMLTNARRIIVSELMLSKNLTQEKAEALLTTCLM